MLISLRLLRARLASACALVLLSVTPGLAQMDTRGDRMLLAASNGDITTVQSVLATGLGVNSQHGIFKRTALHYAAEWGQPEMIRFLLSKGADPSIRDTDGQTPRERANNRHPEVERLLAAAEGVRAQPAPPAPPQARPAPRPAAPTPAPRVNAPRPHATTAGPATWPQHGHYRVGDRVQTTTSGGERWKPAVIVGVGEPGSSREGMYEVHDSAYPDDDGWARDWAEVSQVVGATREPFWTAFFVGDWEVQTGMSAVERTDGRDVYRITEGGMRLPPLRINADGTYTWVVSENNRDRVIRGRWVPWPDGPGIVVLAGDHGTDWTLWNSSTRASDRIFGGDRIRVRSPYYNRQGFRIHRSAPTRR